MQWHYGVTPVHARQSLSRLLQVCCVWGLCDLCAQRRLGTAFVSVTDWRVARFTLLLQLAGTRADIAALSRPRLFMHSMLCATVRTCYVPQCVQGKTDRQGYLLGYRKKHICEEANCRKERGKDRLLVRKPAKTTRNTAELALQLEHCCSLMTSCHPPRLDSQLDHVLKQAALLMMQIVCVP